MILYNIVCNNCGVTIATLELPDNYTHNLDREHFYCDRCFLELENEISLLEDVSSERDSIIESRDEEIEDKNNIIKDQDRDIEGFIQKIDSLQEENKRIIAETHKFHLPQP